jgi:alkaline phosphatase
MKKRTVLFFLTLLSIFICSFNKAPLNSFKEKVETPPKNVILIIADGMGPASFTATRIWAKGSQGKLAMEKMPVTGYVKTYSASDFVTDSAASGTALASGVKTYNGAIGLSYAKVDHKGVSRPLENIADVMKKAGKSVGVLTTTRVTHATPASFYAHVEDRDMEDEIATQVASSSLDLLMGGGRSHFLPDRLDPKNPRRLDGRDLTSELKQKGWNYLSHKKELMNFKNKSAQGPLLGMFNESHVSYERIRKTNSADSEPSLKEMANFAVNFLGDNKKGFFLMIEAGRIDHASHDNNIEDMLRETLMLDECVGELLSSPLMKETLLVITADHETAGLAISGYADVDVMRGDKLTEVKKDETGILSSHVSWATGPNGNNNQKSSSDTLLHPSAQYTSEANHTAIDVMVLSSGPGSSSFMGFMNNTEIPRKILATLGLSFTSPVNAQNPISL